MDREVDIMRCSYPELRQVLQVRCSIIQACGDDIRVIGIDDHSFNLLILDTVYEVEDLSGISLLMS